MKLAFEISCLFFLLCFLVISFYKAFKESRSRLESRIDARIKSVWGIMFRALVMLLISSIIIATFIEYIWERDSTGRNVTILFVFIAEILVVWLPFYSVMIFNRHKQ